MDLEHTILKIIRKEKKAPFISACLGGLSLFYRCAVAMRNFGFNLGYFSSTKLSVPVISVGNIVAGGTGKTPLVQLLATLLQETYSVSILTRGYRSQMEKLGGIHQISTGSGPLYTAQECGDEPFLLAQKTRASIWVGADRVLSGQKAVAKGAQCLLLDDGLQHRRLKRDFEIIVLDGRDPFSEGKFLPSGLLRDSLQRLKSGTVIVVTHVEDLSHFENLKKLISVYSSAPLIGTQIAVIGRERFHFEKVGVFCGLGNPTHFLKTVRDLKSEIIDTLILHDHQAAEKNLLETFAKNCQQKGAKALLCTEKDYVKLPPNLTLALEIIPVAIEPKIVFGRDHWEQLIETISFKVEK